jgi:hypothetical protein
MASGPSVVDQPSAAGETSGTDDRQSPEDAAWPHPYPFPISGVAAR